MNEDTIGNMRTISPAPASAAMLGVVDRYTLLQQLGQGGFGSVWKATDGETGLDIAVKVLHPLIAANPDELERVRQNFALVSRLTHPGICMLRHLHKIDRIDEQAQANLQVQQGGFLVVMDFVDGVTLTQYRLVRGGTLPFDEAVELCGQIADALDYAHSQQIVHRDIKPSNVMVSRGRDGGQAVKVLDFGLAAEIRSSLSRVSRDLGDTTGTRPYMPPEQWLGKRQNAKSDQYSLAVLLYELLSGDVPFASAFESGDPVVMTSVVREQEPEPIPDLEAARSGVLLKALAKERDDRWETCREFVDGLRRRRAAKVILKEDRLAAVVQLEKAPTEAPSGQPSLPAPAKSVELPPARKKRATITLIAIVLAAMALLGFAPLSSVLSIVFCVALIRLSVVQYRSSRRLAGPVLVVILGLAALMLFRWAVWFF